MVFGKKGSGKSTLMVRLAYKYLAAGWDVYCTERLDGCYFIDYKDVGFKNIPPHSVLLVDEVGMVWDCRNHKNFPPEVRDWFKLQRHYKVKVYLFSQTFDVDKKIRDLVDDNHITGQPYSLFFFLFVTHHCNTYTGSHCRHKTAYCNISLFLLKWHCS